jgi:hypothetical protein
MYNLLIQVFLMDPDDIDISIAECPTHGLLNPTPEPTTDEFNLF